MFVSSFRLGCVSSEDPLGSRRQSALKPHRAGDTWREQPNGIPLHRFAAKLSMTAST
jgi:hypothetical protein